MEEIIDVTTGEIAVRKGRFVLRAVAIGSCVVIAAYDSKTETAGMAHIMLPDSAPEKALNKTRYAAEAIDEISKKMIQAGSKKCDIEVCLVGGANVLQSKDDTICETNIKSVTQLLKENNISIKAEVLGGTKRKSVFLDAETGSISYSEGDGPEIPLWKPAMESASK